MPTILDRLNARLRNLHENAEDTSWKDPHSRNYDRQWAEDALFHTLGPLTDSPQWASKWSSPSQPVPGFTPGGPAPSWTKDELVTAYAGDPKLLFKTGGQDNPRSPAYGNRGGAPLYRLARSISRKYNRDKDKSFIEDMYANGFVELSKLMHPGYDERRSPFISWVHKNVESAMEHGTSGSGLQAIRAGGDISKDTNLIGLQGLLKANSPEEARKVAEQVKGKYQQERHHDRTADNPFGQYSSTIYQLAMNYATALDGGDEAAQNRIRQQVETLMDKIKEDQTMVPGASTGMGQAVSTQDRVSSVGVSSMNVPSADGKGEFGDTIGQESTSDIYADVDPEAVDFILRLALEHDIGAAIGHIPKYQAMAAQFGLKPGDKIGGRLTANEFRWALRQMGHLGSQYPGKGTMRAAANIPRDKQGWWKPGEDPEMEPIPAGGIWHSIWTRNGYPPVGGTEIAREMTEEVGEFTKLGIPTARTIKAKTGGVSEAVSKVAIGNTIAAALIKLKLIAAIHRSDLGMDESKNLRHAGIPLMEDYDPIDRRLINEAWDWLIHVLTKAVMLEKAPPGFSGTVDAMQGKHDMSSDKAFGIAWSMYKKGAKSHKPPTTAGDKYKSPEKWQKERAAKKD